MNYKDKFLAQVATCFIIFAAIQGSDIIKQEDFVNLRAKIEAQTQKNYTLEEVKEAGKNLLDKVFEAPAAFTNVVIEANQLSEYGAPMDEEGSEPVQAVHATGGGVVIYAGIDSELGCCIKIQHQDKVSTYGNLYTLTVVTDERVTKGQIIGTFDNSGEKEFYYELA